MNTKNNKRRRESIQKIENALIEILMTKELKQASVSDICKLSGLNRSTFYANFVDVYDLADKLREKIEQEFLPNFAQDLGIEKLFAYIYENQILYKTYFKLQYNENHKFSLYDESRAREELDIKYIDYHIEFFRNGFNAIVRMWLDRGCKETPEEMAQILRQEYRQR